VVGIVANGFNGCPQLLMWKTATTAGILPCSFVDDNGHGGLLWQRWLSIRRCYTIGWFNSSPSVSLLCSPSSCNVCSYVTPRSPPQRRRTSKRRKMRTHGWQQLMTSIGGDSDSNGRGGRHLLPLQLPRRKRNSSPS
jgi:hypothetical protein